VIEIKAVFKFTWMWFLAQWTNEIIEKVTVNWFKQYLNLDFKDTIEWWTQDLTRKWIRENFRAETSNQSNADSNDWLGIQEKWKVLCIREWT
jgi:hypothetical protein